MLAILKSTATGRQQPWHEATSVNTLMKLVGKEYEDEVVDEVFWWMVVDGVVAFNDIDLWNVADDEDEDGEEDEDEDEDDDESSRTGQRTD